MGVGRHRAVKVALYLTLLTHLLWYKLVFSPSEWTLACSSFVGEGNLWPSAMTCLIALRSPGQFIKDVLELIVYYPDYHM